MTITRLDYPLPIEKFYADFFTLRRPLIIKTRVLAELGWRTHLWSNDYLRYKAGSQEVLVQRRYHDRVFLPENSSYTPMTFRDFLSEVMENPQGDDDKYLNLQHLHKNMVIEPPALQLVGDFSIPMYFKDLALRCINIWMGNSRTSTVTPLHHDFNDNLYVVVEGRKHFTLFPPEQAPNLYLRGEVTEIGRNGIIQYRNMDGMPHVSQLDPSHVDANRFPAYEQAAPTRMDFDLEKNEMLFLPAGWFHQVSSSGRHIAVSFFAETPPADRLDWIRSALMQRNPSPKQPAG